MIQSSNRIPRYAQLLLRLKARHGPELDPFIGDLNWVPDDSPVDLYFRKIATELVTLGIQKRLLMMIVSNKYILLNAPNENLQQIISLLPGMKSPTVLPLAEPGWSSVHSVLNENEFWEIIEKLKAAGAQGILVIPIEKMIV